MEQISMSSSWKSPKIILIALGMILLSTIIVFSIIRDRFVNQPQWQVTINGQGKIAYKPDIALLTVGVQIDKAPSAEIALKRLNETISKLIPAIKRAGVSDGDILNQNYSLNPQYDYINNVQTLAGYSANQQLVIKIRDFANNPDRVNTIIGEANKNGANQILGVAFDVENASALKQQARLKAIEDARNQAGSLVSATGVKLGKIVGWWENVIQAPGNPNPYMYADGKGGAGGSAPTPQVPNGNQEIIIEVGLNYQIK